MARRRDEVCGARDLIFGLKVGLEDPPGLHTLRRMIIAEIERMDTAERLRTMEALWDALCREPTEPESPKWHESLLEARRNKIESGEAKFISLDEVRRRLQESCKLRRDPKVSSPAKLHTHGSRRSETYCSG